jgi:hypothetical protein
VRSNEVDAPYIFKKIAVLTKLILYE